MDATLKATSQLEALRTSAPVDPFDLISRARADVGRLKTVLESYGFYQGTVTITVNALGLDHPGLADTLAALPKGTDAQCRIAFDLGPQYHLGRIDIDGSLPESARKSLQLSSGAPAIASEVLAGGARLLTTLQNDGYAFAKVDPPVAYENPTEHVLDLRFHVVAGPRVQIGKIHLEGLQHVKERLVRRRLLVHTGERYSAIAVERARKDLLGLGVFSTADTQLGTAPDDLGRVPVTFRLRERLRHAVSANAAYSTDLDGRISPTLDLRASIRQVDSDLVSAFVPSLLAQGTLDADAQLQGTPKAPTGVATVKASRLRLASTAQGLHLSDITAHITAEHGMLQIDRLTARAAPGEITASGTIGVLEPQMPIQIQLSARNAQPITSDVLTANLNADLAVKGTLRERIDLTGTINPKRAVIGIPSGLPPDVAVLDVRRPGEAPPAPPEHALVIGLDLRVHAPRSVLVQGRGLDAELGGDLHAVAGSIPSRRCRSRWGSIGSRSEAVAAATAGRAPEALTVEAGRYVPNRVYVGARESTTGFSQVQVDVDLSKRLKLQTRLGNGSASTQGATPENDPGSSIGLMYQLEY